MFDSLTTFIRDYYRSLDVIPLHAPLFQGCERQYVLESIDSTFVSSIGPFVDRFEVDVASYTGAAAAVATVNGSAALHIALKLAGVEDGDLVLTQSLTFVATCNAITYSGADPVFIDVDLATLGLAPLSAEAWLAEHAFVDDDGFCRHRPTGRIIRACLPVHTFGHPADIEGLSRLCECWQLNLVEDAAESLGSLYKGRHTGTFGTAGTLSFNGNKIATAGGGGMILTSPELAARAKHLTTTAKQPHLYEYTHDELGYNYRLPNLNAALGCAQLEQLETFIEQKRALAQAYCRLLQGSELEFVQEPKNCRSNYWLNAVVCTDRSHRDALLNHTHKSGILTRPVWRPMHQLPMYSRAASATLENTEWLADRLVNLPSSAQISGQSHA